MYTIEIDKKIHTLFHPVKSAGSSIHAGIIGASMNFTEGYKVHCNQRHAGIQNLPAKFQDENKYIVLRPPHEWYQSFYRFFLGVEGYLSFMLNDPKDPENGFIYPLGIDEFIIRSLNFKDTLIKYPNKARVFRNLLRSQAHMHFVTGYFDGDFSPEAPETMEQFDCTLYEWFHRPFGEDCIFIPMSRLDIIENIFKVSVPHVNKTSDKKPESPISPEVIEMIKDAHSEYYDMIENFKATNLRTIKEYKAFHKIQGEYISQKTIENKKSDDKYILKRKD